MEIVSRNKPPTVLISLGLQKNKLIHFNSIVMFMKLQSRWPKFDEETEFMTSRFKRTSKYNLIDILRSKNVRLKVVFF